jgi:spore germination cell wall hydrolase CwlJ-like protein
MSKSVARKSVAQARRLVDVRVFVIASVLLVAAFVMLASTAVRAAPPHDDIRCLAQTIYFEARGEPDTGKLAVGHVVMNRVLDRRFPADVCEVVRQGGEERRYLCQFTWWCDGRSDTPQNVKSWDRSLMFARMIYWGFTQDPTDGALWYHADYVAPYWKDSFKQGPKIGRHIFYVRVGEKPVQTARRQDPVFDGIF